MRRARTSDPPASPGRVFRSLAAIAALTMTACREGYSVDEPTTITPQNMTQAQRLAAMNRLGSEAHRERAWSYALESACILSVRRADDAAGQWLSVPLADVTVESSRDKATKLFIVRVVQGGSASMEETVVLETPHWTDSVELRALLESVQRGCGSTSTQSPEGL